MKTKPFKFKASKPNIDLHVYLTPEDQDHFVQVKQAMISLGMPSKLSPQAVIRFALRRAAKSA